MGIFYQDGYPWPQTGTLGIGGAVTLSDGEVINTTYDYKGSPKPGDNVFVSVQGQTDDSFWKKILLSL